MRTRSLIDVMAFPNFLEVWGGQIESPSPILLAGRKAPSQALSAALLACCVAKRPSVARFRGIDPSILTFIVSRFSSVCHRDLGMSESVSKPSLSCSGVT